jgi:hypothetical protein
MDRLHCLMIRRIFSEKSVLDNGFLSTFRAVDDGRTCIDLGRL